MIRTGIFLNLIEQVWREAPGEVACEVGWEVGWGRHNSASGAVGNALSFVPFEHMERNKFGYLTPTGSTYQKRVWRSVLLLERLSNKL